MASKLSPFSLISLLFHNFPFSSTLKKEKKKSDSNTVKAIKSMCLYWAGTWHVKILLEEKYRLLAQLQSGQGKPSILVDLDVVVRNLIRLPGINFHLVIFWKSLSSPWKLIPRIIVHCLQASFCYLLLLTEQNLISSFHLIEVLLKATSMEPVYVKCCPCH